MPTAVALAEPVVDVEALEPVEGVVDVEPVVEVLGEAPPAPASSRVWRGQNLVRFDPRSRPRPEMVAPSLEALAPVAEFAPLVDRARQLVDASRSLRTRKTYAKEWALFCAWCERHSTGLRQLTPLPAHPSTVALYVTELATTPVRNRWGRVIDARGRKPRGINVAVAAIAYEHVLSGRASPTYHPDVRSILQGIARERGLRPAQKAPLLPPHMHALVMAQGLNANPLIALRNRSLFLMHWAGAFRRSEVVALTLEDVEWCDEGLRVRVGRSKTDQKGEGKVKAIPRGANPDTCPVRALEAWLEAARIKFGYIYVHVDRWGHLRQRLTDHAVAVLLKEWAPAAKLDPADVSGHSPRSGFVTAAARARRQLPAIMRQTGHTRVETVLGYVREAELFTDHAGAGLL